MNRNGIGLAIAAILLVAPSLYLMGELTSAPEQSRARGGADDASARRSADERGSALGSSASAADARRRSGNPLDVADVAASASISRGVYAFSPGGSSSADASGERSDASYRNRDASFRSAGQFFDPRDLAVLEDIIRLNGLSEDSSSFDYDNGDGVFEPTELGSQIWCGSRLRGLLMGPTSESSFGYTLRELPETVSNLEYLMVLEANATGLEALPPTLGRMADLQRLSAYGNRVKEIPPELALAERLEEIQLDGNQISSVPKELQEKPRLKALFVDGNPIRELPPMVERQYQKLMSRKLVLSPRELGAFGSDCRVL